MGCAGSSETKAETTPSQTSQKQKLTSTDDKGRPKGPKLTANGKTLVMGKYEMHNAKEDIMGEGTSSICRRGTDLSTGQDVAIKVYKDQKGGGKVKDVTMQKFKRQIHVLKELGQPFKKPADESLWHSEMNSVKPSRVFMQLLDYSKNAAGEPAPDKDDGVLYVVTELAQYSLKDFLSTRREQSKQLSADEIRNITKAIIMAMAGLHAKGYVHIDMKPENMMMFSGRLKVIDVDGCVRAGTKVSIQDSSISFSPCYCAPEWARFLIKDNQPNITAAPALDVWSVGMTLCELVSMDAILKPQYANFLRNASSHREAGFLFMEWLSSMRKAPVPKAIEKGHPEFADLIAKFLLVPKQAERKSCAQALAHPFIKSATSKDKALEEKDGDAPIRRQRDRPEDESVDRPLHMGTLWKLNRAADPKDAASWIKRDMWIASNHSLCYFSVKENKRLVLIDGKKLTTGGVTNVSGVGKDHAFKVELKSDEENDVIMLAGESADELKVWIDKLSKATSLDAVVTMQLGAQFAEDVQKFKLAVKNRRMKIEEEDAGQFVPIFKAKLWKLKTEGDRKKKEDWFLREMWVAKNGSVVYWSPKEERELVYYTTDDLARAAIAEIVDGECCFDHAFRITLPPVGDVEFTPGEFAAESKDLRKQWMNELKKFAH
jgi:serine/threonine protein kinase